MFTQPSRRPEKQRQCKSTRPNSGYYIINAQQTRTFQPRANRHRTYRANRERIGRDQCTNNRHNKFFHICPSFFVFAILHKSPPLGQYDFTTPRICALRARGFAFISCTFGVCDFNNSNCGFVVTGKRGSPRTLVQSLKVFFTILSSTE